MHTVKKCHYTEIHEWIILILKILKYFLKNRWIESEQKNITYSA